MKELPKEEQNAKSSHEGVGSNPTSDMIFFSFKFHSSPGDADDVMMNNRIYLIKEHV